MVGPAHEGYDGNYRQNVLRWSMQINTSRIGAQIDIDPFNPAAGLAGLFAHFFGSVLPNHLADQDTDPFTISRALGKRGVNVGAPCTGN